MASSDLHYFILRKAEKSLFTRKPGQICSAKSYKLKKQGKSLDVVFTDSIAGVDYPIDRENLQPISQEEAGLLMAIPEEDRLAALNQPQGLRSARRLREGTEVFVEVGSDLLKGTIRYIGNITEPKAKRDVPGVFYGVELQGSDRGRGSTDGSFRYKRCFYCEKKCGVFAPFHKIIAVETSPDPPPGLSSKSRPESSPDSQPRERPNMKLEMRLSLKSKQEPRPNPRSDLNQHPDQPMPLSSKRDQDQPRSFSLKRDQGQPISFLSNHFQHEPPQREYRPEYYREDSGPKSLSVDPEPMEQDPVYENPDQPREPTNGFNRFRSNSTKEGPVSDQSKMDRKHKPKLRYDLTPGSAKRAAAPIQESRPESKEVDHVNSSSKPDKMKLATHRSRPEFGLGPRSQSESESGATLLTEARSGPEFPVGTKPDLGLETGDQVLFINEAEETVKGTFLYMKDTEGVPVVRIRGDSEMSFDVPLVGVMKLDPEAEDISANTKVAPGLEFEDPRPESKEVDHVTSSSKPDKMKLATHRSHPQFGLGLRSQSESESGALKTGLKPGFGLHTGDRVLFINEKEETVKGTFLFMKDTEGVTMAHIEGESETYFIVPLVEIMKLEPEAENIYADPKGAPGLEFEEPKPESRPHMRPESEEPDHKKNQFEAQPKAKPRTKLESRPENRPESREGPKPGLRHGSTDGLTAGDQVVFLGEKEQVLEGTVVLVEDSEGHEGTMVHIAGKSGTFFVPLRCVTKTEPKTNSADLYMDPDSMAPPVEYQEGFSSLGVDSVVEIDLAKGGKGFGTIRWIGFIPNVQHKMAGLELEEKKGVSDGTFMGKRFFSCPERYALFVKLSSCRPDSRFCRTPANHNSPYTADSANQNIRNGKEHSGPRTGPHHNGFTAHQNADDTDDLEPVPPITTENVERLLVGRMRGIQGHHNSCYMDSALFSLFSVSSVLDSLLFKSTTPRDAEVQRILLQNIVNPLRRYGFVEGRHVMNLRKQLQKHGFSQTFTTDEKDPEEFLTVIMQHILNLDPLLKLSSGGKVQDSFCFQIFLDQTQDLVLPSVQQLLEHSFHSNKLKLSEVPSCLILQMPRFGKKFKMFDKILPSLELDVTDLLLQGPKQCILCGEAALWECPECFLDPVFSSNGVKLFCDQCSRQVHTHSCRQSHHPDRLDTHHGGHSEHFHGNRDKLHLLAVLCIETSHYVSFIKYGPEPQHWLFFDSMADREGEADGYNVPQVTLAPEVSQYLDMSLSELANQVPRDMKGVAKRLICDAYLYLYQSPALHLYT